MAETYLKQWLLDLEPQVNYAWYSALQVTLLKETSQPIIIEEQIRFKFYSKTSKKTHNLKFNHKVLIKHTLGGP